METPKKRKRSAVEMSLPLITYDAATRTFDRLFKEDSLDAMKEVVRKKLGVSEFVPVYLSQIRDGRSVDLEDDDDFEAFQTAAQASSSAKVKVALGADRPTEVLSSSRKKRNKRKKQDATSGLALEGAVDTSGADALLSDEPPSHKKRRVTFVEPPSEEQTESGLTTSTPKKKKSRTSNDSSDRPVNDVLLPNHDVGSISEGDNDVLSEKTKKKRKKNKKEKKDEMTEPVVDDIGSTTPSVTKVNEAAIPTSDQALSATSTGDTTATNKSKKRQRAEASTSEEPAGSSTSQNLQAGEDQNPPPPYKKSKKKKRLNDDEPTAADGPLPEQPSNLDPKKQSSKSSIPPSETQNPEPPASSPEEKKSRKGKEKAVSEPAKNLPAAAIPEPAPLQTEQDVETKKKKKKKSKQNIDEDIPTDQPSTTTQAEIIVSEKDKGSVGVLSAEPTKKKNPKKSSDIVNTHPEPGQSSSRSASAHAEKDPKEVSSTPTDANAPKKKQKRDEVMTDESSTIPEALQKPTEKLQETTGKADMKELTNAAVLAILAKKGLTKPASDAATAATTQDVAPEPPTTSLPVPNVPAVDAAQAAVSKPKSPPACPICYAWPTHLRSKCPVVKSGIRFMRKRMAELEADTSGDNAAQEKRKLSIAEIQIEIDKKTRKPRVAAAPTAAEPSKAPLPPSSLATEKQVDVVVSPHAVVDVVISDPPAQPAIFTRQFTPSQPPPPAQLQPPPIRLHSPSQKPTASRKGSQRKHTPAQTGTNSSAAPPHVEDPNFVGSADVTLFTDKDLQALIHGPRRTIKDLPSASEDEDEGDQENVDLEEDEVTIKQPKHLGLNSSRVGYAASSDEGDGDDEDEDEDELPLASRTSSLKSAETLEVDEQQKQTAKRSSELEVDGLPEQAADMSFKDVDERGSSRELDRTGNDAVDDALMHDLAPFNMSEPPSSIKDKTGEPDSDTAVASQGEEGPVVHERPLEKEGPTDTIAGREHEVADPIEPAGESPRAEIPESIVSEDEAPVQSTPKVEVVLRTRSQKSKAALPTGDALPSSQATQTQEAANTPKPTRKTRSLTRISELPIPPNPSVRVIKHGPATSVRTRGQSARRGSQVNGVINDAQEVDGNSSNNGSVMVEETPAKTPAKGKKPSAKPVSKAAKTPAKAKAKVSTNGTAASRARTADKIVPVDPIPAAEETVGATSDKAAGTDWAVLPESNQSQATGTPPIDELQSSPNEAAITREPLFLHSDTQQSFPYSQYPDILPPSSPEKEASLNDSQDEEEVAASVVKPPKPTARWRGLSEMASQIFATPKFSPAHFPNAKEPERDLFGRISRREESEEGTDDSDSDIEPPPSSHIPLARKAGVALKRK